MSPDKLIKQLSKQIEEVIINIPKEEVIIKSPKEEVKKNPKEEENFKENVIQNIIPMKKRDVSCGLVS